MHKFLIKRMLFCIFLACCLPAAAISPDSLEKRLPYTKDTQHIHILQLLAREYMYTDTGKALLYVRESAGQSREIAYAAGMAEAYSLYGYYYSLLGMNDTAVDYYCRALDMAKDVKDGEKKARLLDNIADAYISVGQYDTAHQILETSLGIRQKAGDRRGMAVSYGKIGIVYTYYGYYTEALRYFLKAVPVLDSLQDNKLLAYNYVYLAIVYTKLAEYPRAIAYYDLALNTGKTQTDKQGERELGIYLNRSTLYVYQKQYDHALADLQQAEHILSSVNNTRALAAYYTNKGTVYKETGRYRLAGSYYQKAIDISEKGGDIFSLTLLYNSMGEIAAYDRLFVQAIAWLEKGRDLAYRSEVLENIKENAQVSAKIYLQMKDYRQAYHYNEIFHLYQDSIINEENRRKIAELNIQFETEKKEKEIALLSSEKQQQELDLHKKNFQLSLFVVAFIAFAGISGFLYYRNKIKQRVQEQEMKYMQERVRIETELQERMRIAKDLHDELGSGISKVMLSNQLARQRASPDAGLDQLLVSMDKTLAALAANMNDLIWSLQQENATWYSLAAKMREFASDFLDSSSIRPSFDFPEDVPDRIFSKELLRDVFLVYKESLHNVLKHAAADTVWIEVAYEQSFLTVRVRDNGKGLKEAPGAKRGNGLKNMENRIRKHQGIFRISPGEAGGTEVYFAVPV